MHLSQARAFLRRHAYGLSWWLALAFVLYATYSLFMVHSRRLDQPYLIGMDPNYYFAWGRSVLMDGDIDFANDFSFIGDLDGAPGHFRTRRDFALLMADPPATPTGLVPNKYGMGMGLLSLPLMTVARAASFVYSGVTGVEVSEFAAIYPMAMIATSVLMGFIGLAISYRILRELYGRRCAFWATVAGCAGLSLIHYLIYEPAMAHAMGFGMASLFLLSALAWLRLLERCAERLSLPKPDEPRGSSPSIWKVALSAALMGWLLGVLCLVRYPDAVFALVPLVLVAVAYARRKKAERGHWIALSLLSLGCALAGTIAGFLPQLFAWKTLYGSWITYSYSGESWTCGRATPGKSSGVRSIVSSSGPRWLSSRWVASCWPRRAARRWARRAWWSWGRYSGSMGAGNSTGSVTAMANADSWMALSSSCWVSRRFSRAFRAWS
ncbi:hypothetical protein IIC65_06265 [Candidatus Sumerlaeota bacterium]|nr:hypothetical protein [Candidatus Sumerlaeota bacterium]